jgi:hypothetical protein
MTYYGTAAMTLGKITGKKVLEGLVELCTKWAFVMILSFGALLALGELFSVPGSIATVMIPTEFQNKFVTGWHNLTMLVLSAGVFSVVMKSMVLMGVIREVVLEILDSDILRRNVKRELGLIVADGNTALRSELKKDVLDLVYDRDFIEDWNGVHQVWSKLTTQMLRDLLPDIHVPIRSEILESYFSKGTCNYYMEGYDLKARIAFTESGKLEITETVKFDIVARDPDTDVLFKYTSDLPVPAETGKSSMEIKVLMVNQESMISHVSKVMESFDGFEREVFRYSIELKGARRYTVERHAIRIQDNWDEKDGPSRGTRFARYVKNFSVVVEHPPELVVFFKTEGAIKEGLVVNGEEKRLQKGYLSSDTVLHMLYRGIVLPKQGFRIFWHRRQ